MPVKFLVPVPPFRHNPTIACKDVDPEIFYPLTYRYNSARHAKKICQTCPLMNECAAWAVKVGEPDGIWGGLDPHERRSMRRNAI